MPEWIHSPVLSLLFKKGENGLNVSSIVKENRHSQTDKSTKNICLDQFETLFLVPYLLFVYPTLILIATSNLCSLFCSVIVPRH